MDGTLLLTTGDTGTTLRVTLPLPGVQGGGGPRVADDSATTAAHRRTARPPTAAARAAQASQTVT